MNNRSFAPYGLPLVAMIAACGGGSAESKCAAVPSTGGGNGIALSGPWINATPCNPSTAEPPAAGVMKCDGETRFKGTMEGASHYYLTGRTLANGDIAATLTETFTVKLASGAAGSFDMHEAFFFEAATGKISITGYIASGTGAFANARGHLSFPGTTDATGVGTGTYSGVIRL